MWSLPSHLLLKGYKGASKKLTGPRSHSWHKSDNHEAWRKTCRSVWERSTSRTNSKGKIGKEKDQHISVTSKFCKEISIASVSFAPEIWNRTQMVSLYWNLGRKFWNLNSFTLAQVMKAFAQLHDWYQETVTLVESNLETDWKALRRAGLQLVL